MSNNTGPVAKLYLSIIDDVIDDMRELFSDEGLEDRVLDDLKHLWESKMMQSKAMEDFRKNNVNPSNFVLQLPANSNHPDQELTAPAVIPANQNINSFPAKNNSEVLATFSLPAGLIYPVQIPAGVTIQTASGQLYKVNVPVVVTQAPGNQQPLSQHTQTATEQREAPAPPNPIAPPEAEPSSVPASSDTQPVTSLPPIQQSGLCQHSPEPEVTLGENEPQTEPMNLSMRASPCTQLLGDQIRTEDASMQAVQNRDIDDILREVIEQEMEKAKRVRSGAPVMDGQSESALGLDLDDYMYSVLSDIIQLDGPADDSDLEENGVPQDESDFLGLINAEAIKALKEENGSSDSNRSSSSSGGEEDPLNSGDDVIEQDIPDLFDTDNVIVCQYDKIHRSKNRWKFNLKDGVMCYGGRDYVFSKAVGEAEW